MEGGAMSGAQVPLRRLKRFGPYAFAIALLAATTTWAILLPDGRILCGPMACIGGQPLGCSCGVNDHLGIRVVIASVGAYLAAAIVFFVRQGRRWPPRSTET